MSFLDRIRACNNWDITHFRPFHINGERVGWVKPSFVEHLQPYRDVFRVTEASLTLAVPDSSLEGRSKAVDSVLRELAAQGAIKGWRDERYPVSVAWGALPLLYMERAAVPYFGVRAYGLHVNGLVQSEAGPKMWIARRAYDRPTFPGMLDNMVAGGQPVGISLLDNLVKECREEANLPESLARSASPIGSIAYNWETEEGLKPDIQFIYDLELPPSFVPENTDGEIQEFYLWSMPEIMERVRDTSEFKFNCSLVVIDFLIRHGLIAPQESDYLKMTEALGRQDSENPGRNEPFP